jgi:ketosteroid isomerase-like protein
MSEKNLAMSEKNLATAESYYYAMQSRDHNKMGNYLHEDVKYVDPNWPVTGKKNVLRTGQAFAEAVEQITPVAKLSANDQVMLVYDVKFRDARESLKTAILMKFDGGLIKELELISDVSKHMVEGDAIGDVCKKIFSYAGLAMSEKNLATAEAYYSAVQSRDYNKMGNYLHEDVKYVDPNWPVTGKKNVLRTGQAFAEAVEQITPVAKLSANDQVMLVYDVKFRDARESLKTAILMKFDGGLIKELELISDVSKHMVEGDAIGDVCKKIFSYAAA